MNPFCPNLSNSQINSEFNELVDSFLEMALGDREKAKDMAYYLWDKNEGYSIDKAPSGEPSKLFLSHLEALNGDRREALRLTAKDLSEGKSHDDVMFLMVRPQSNPLLDIKDSISLIGLDSLVSTLVAQGISRDVANAIYNTVKKTPGLENLKPIDIFNILLQLRDSSLKTEYNKRMLAPINRELEKLLMKILASYKFGIKDLGDLITDDESFTLENITAAFDIYNKLIYLSKDRNNLTLPEEFSHAFFRMFGLVTKGKDANVTYKLLRELIKSTDLYKLVEERYKTVYVKENKRFNTVLPDYNKIAEEALGQALAAIIASKWDTGNINAKDKTVFDKIKSWFESILDKIRKYEGKINIFFSGNDEDVISEYNTIEVTKILENLADRILKEDLSMLDLVDDTGYNRLDYSDTIAAQTKKDGGIAVEFMQWFVKEFDAVITGSLSYRKQGTVYRSNQDSLHDIDIQIPFSSHMLTPYSFWSEELIETYKPMYTELWNVPKKDRGLAWKDKKHDIDRELVDLLLKVASGNSDFIDRIRNKYPDMIFTTMYSGANEGFTLSAVWSTDKKLAERFNEMRGSYKDRLNQFTQEELDKIYLFDFFLLLEDNIPAIEDDEYDLMLTTFNTSFAAKTKMGRPKDNFDYLRWEIFDKYKGLYTPTVEGLLFQLNVSKTVLENGKKIRLSLPSHTESNPRQIVLEPQGNKKYYVHIRMWDGEKIPAKTSTQEKLLLFDALYEELPEGAEILIPKSREGYYATRGTIAALLRLSRDPRFVPGEEEGVVLYEDKNNLVKEYRTTSFIKRSEQSYEDSIDELSIYENEDEYVITKLGDYMNSHPNASDTDINIKRRQFINEYVLNRQKQIMSGTALTIAKAFGLTKQGDGSWATQDSDPISKLRVEFVNSIDPEHAGLYEHNSMSVSAHHVIRIGLDKADPTTFNHEMAHHYVRMFWNSEVILNALKIVSKDGMTDIEREEALVEKMVEMSADNVYGTLFDNDNFFHTFWNKFANMLYNVFDIKTNAVRKQLLQNATKAFMLNEELSAIEDERVLFDMADQVMYSKATAKFRSRKSKKEAEPTYRRAFERQDEKITEAIVKHTESKDKAYSRRGGINETQIIKLQDAVYSVRRSAQRIKDAIAAHRVDEAFHEKAELILNYMDRAVEEVANAVRAFDSAVANNYREFVYFRYPDGSIVYTPQGNLHKTITFEDLVNIKSDVLSFHENLIGSIGTMLNDAAAIKGFSSDDIDRIKDKYNTLKLNERISEFRHTFDNALDKACVRDIILYIDKNVPLEDEMKTRLKINMLKWLKDQNDYGDVSIYEQWVGLGSHSKSPVIRMMQDIINDLLYERDVPVEERGKHINNLLLAARKATTPGMFGISKYNIKIGKFNLPTPWNIQKLLMEKGRNGLPTGNFATEINKGQYDMDKEDFIATLLYGKDGQHGIEKKIRDFSINGTNPYKDFELSLDKYNTPIFPDDISLESIIKEYYTELEKWRCENEDRLFTEAYYLKRVEMLSPTTLMELDNINSAVSEIYTACTVNGVVRTDLLTGVQRNDLISLRRRRTQLYNFYNEDGTLKARDSREYKIANDLALWSMFIKDKVKYKIDYDKYNQALSLARDKNLFEKDNTSLIINPKVWEYYNEMVNSYKDRFDQTDPDVIKLNKLVYQRNKLINTIKEGERGFYNMSLIWDDSTKTLKNRNFWVNLQALETSIYRLNKQLRAKYSSRRNSSDSSDNKENFKKVFFNIQVPVDPNGVWFGNTVPRWLSKIKSGVRHTAPDDVKLLYITGTSNPLSIFLMLVPYFRVDKYVDANGNVVEKRVLENNHGEVYDIYIKAPNSNFSVIDKAASDGNWVNKNFDSSDGKSYRPKKSKYKNNDFDKIANNPALKNLYDELINTMKESWSMIPFLGDYDYRLPQMRGRTGQVLGRRKNIFKSIGYQFASWWEINENDEWFNNDYQTRPDGSRMDFIPIRFIKRLDRPEYISSDVAGSVILFFNMAKNYQIKSKVVPQFEAYLWELSKNKSGDHKSWSDVSQENILQHMIDVQMYGREQVVTVDSKKNDRHGSKRIARWMKRVKQSRGWAQSSLLAFNFASAIVSALDPMMSLTLDMLTGKYTNYKDFFYALGVLFTDMPRAFMSLGSVNTYSKANAAMLFFLLSKNNSATFRDLDRSLFMRFMSDGLPMKIFTIGDYTINCITMISTMNNYKLYTYKDSTEQNPHKKFFKKDEFIQEAISDGRTEEEAYTMYNRMFGEPSLWDAFEVKGGRFTVKDEFKDLVDDLLLKNIRKQAQSRSSIYNGVVPDNERTKLQTNVWTAFITMLRNFLIMGINERFKSQRDFLVSNFEDYGRLGLNIENDELLVSTPEEIENTKKQQSYLKGGWNFSTRTIEDGVFIGFGHVIRNMYTRSKYFLGSIARSKEGNYEAKLNIYQLSDFDKYAGKKVALELMSIALLYIVSLFANQQADDDKDDYGKQLFALIATRLPTERLTFYSPTLVSDLITSPTSAISAFRRFLLILNLASDLIGMSDYSINDYVQQGTYGGKRRWFKDVCGILSGYGAHNFVTNTDAKALREKNKFYKKLLPIDLHNIDAIIELFGIDLMQDRSSGGSSGSGGFGGNFGGSFGGSFGGGF